MNGIATCILIATHLWRLLVWRASRPKACLILGGNSFCSAYYVFAWMRLRLVGIVRIVGIVGIVGVGGRGVVCITIASLRTVDRRIRDSLRLRWSHGKPKRRSMCGREPGNGG